VLEVVCEQNAHMQGAVKAIDIYAQYDIISLFLSYAYTREHDSIMPTVT